MGLIDHIANLAVGGRARRVGRSRVDTALQSNTTYSAGHRLMAAVDIQASYTTSIPRLPVIGSGISEAWIL